MDVTPPPASPPPPPNRWAFAPDEGPNHSPAWRRWRLVLLGLTAALVVLATVAVVLAVLLVRSFHQKQQLLGELQAARVTFRDLRDQKDVLMARLVAIQGPQEVLEGAADGARDLPPAAEETAASSAEAAPAGQPAVAAQTAPAGITEPPPPLLEVADFSVSPEADSRGLEIRFKIVNTGNSGGPVAGYSFVYLKPGEAGPERWRVLPAAALVDGKPADVKQGQYFSIAHHIYQTFRAEAVEAPEGLKTATVAVFEKNGRILLQRDFDLDLTAWPGAGAPAAGRVQSAAEPLPLTVGQPAAHDPAAAWPKALPYSIHTDSFTRRARAEKRARALAEMAYDSFVLAAWVPGKGSYYRVFVGRFSDRAGAGRVLQEMQTRRAAPPDSRIVARSWALP